MDQHINLSLVPSRTKLNRRELTEYIFSILLIIMGGWHQYESILIVPVYAGVDWNEIECWHVSLE